MLFAQFYNFGAISQNELFEACGDRAVIVYDARVNKANILDDARKECIKRGFVGYSLFKGETFTRSNRITEIYRLENKGK